MAISAQVDAALPAVEFDTPAQVSGELDATGLTWVLLIFRDAGATFEAELQAESTTNKSYVAIDTYLPGWVGGTPSFPARGPVEPMQGDFNAEISFHDEWSSLYIEASSIRLHASDMGALLNVPDGRPITEFQPQRRIPSETYDGFVPPKGLLWAIDSPDPSKNFDVNVQAEGVHVVEWHNATLDCSSEQCLDGARDQGFTMPFPGGWVGGRILSLREVTSSNGTIRGQGAAWIVVAGGEPLTSEVNGWLRLPNASVVGTCGDAPCEDPAGRTLQVQGRIRLEAMEASHGSERRVTSQFAASEAVAQIDESPAFDLTASSAWAIAAASGAGLLVVGVKALLGLFARNTRPLLDHPRAKAIHDLVHSTPGLSFTEIKRATGWAYGSVQYQLRRLLQAGLIVAYAHGNGRQTYYENHGRHKEDWKAYAALRKPELHKLHEWIANHPQARQGGIIEATAEWGWKRAITQHRLKKLMAAGLVKEYRPSVLAVHYVAIQPQVARNSQFRSSAVDLGVDDRQPA